MRPGGFAHSQNPTAPPRSQCSELLRLACAQCQGSSKSHFEIRLLRCSQHRESMPTHPLIEPRAQDRPARALTEQYPPLPCTTQIAPELMLACSFVLQVIPQRVLGALQTSWAPQKLSFTLFCMDPVSFFRERVSPNRVARTVIRAAPCWSRPGRILGHDSIVRLSDCSRTVLCAYIQGIGIYNSCAACGAS